MRNVLLVAGALWLGACSPANVLEGSISESYDLSFDYIRARRYLPERGLGLRGTALRPDTFSSGFFATGVPHRITVVKVGVELFMRITSDARSMLLHWDTSSHPPVTEGRVGLRHMWTRAARYRDFRIFCLDPAQ